MSMTIPAPDTLVSYYKGHQFNPVPISVDTRDDWQTQIDKRQNLYANHLGIPFSLLRDRSVLEFGCNSGENALVLAQFGAKLTLAEPNQQVHPRLRERFRNFGLEKQIIRLEDAGVQDFQSDTQYDLVIAEGFINHLSDRETALSKIFSFVAPGGLAVISFDCVYGHVMEMTRRYLLWRTCHLSGISDVHSDASLERAHQLFHDDFYRLNTSRPLEAWWKDELVNPFVVWDYLWNHHEILPIAEKAQCEYLSSSPNWASLDRFAWYKNVPTTRERHQQLFDEWHRSFAYFVTGFHPQDDRPASEETVQSVSNFIAEISNYTTENQTCAPVTYPSQLDRFFTNSNDSRLQQFNKEIKAVYETAQGNDPEALMQASHSAHTLRTQWGSPYHYLSFRKDMKIAQ